MLNIAVLVSGGGTNLQALLDSEARGEPQRKDHAGGGLQARCLCAGTGRKGRCGRRGGPPQGLRQQRGFDAALLKTLKSHNIDLVVLAGFLSVLGPASLRPIRAAS